MRIINSLLLLPISLILAQTSSKPQNALEVSSPVVETSQATHVLKRRLTSIGTNSCNSNSDPSISVSSLNVVVQDSSIVLNVNADVKKEITGGIATLQITAAGFSLPNIPFPVCDLSPSGCPIQPGQLKSTKTLTLPSGVGQANDVLNKIPGFGLEFKLTFTSVDGSQQLGCTETTIGNPIDTQAPSISYASYAFGAASVGLALLGGVGNLGLQATHARPGATPSLFDTAMILQGFAINGMLGCNYPATYAGWTTNFGWTMGAINIPSLQVALDNWRPAEFHTVKNVTTDGSGSLQRRDGIANFKWDDIFKSNPNADVGISKYAKMIKVKPENYFLTIVVVFLILFACVTALCLLLRLILELLSMYKPTIFTVLRDHFAMYYLGNLLRVFLLGYCVIAMGALYQLSIHDYWPVTVIAGITLGVFCVGLMGFVGFKVIRAGPSKAFNEPKFKYSMGPLYTDYRVSIYAFFIPNLIYLIVRAIAVALLSKWVLVQLIVLVVNEIVYFIAMLIARPYALRIANGLNVFIGILKIVNLGLLFLFIQSITLPSLANQIISIVLIVLNVLQVVALLIVMIWSLVHTCKKLIKGDGKSDQVPINRNSGNFSNRGPKSSMSDYDYQNVPSSARSPNTQINSTYPNEHPGSANSESTYQPTSNNLRNSYYVTEETSFLDRREDPYYRPKLPWMSRPSPNSQNSSDVESYADSYRMDRTAKHRDENLTPTHL
jgi:hypothetical protein